MAAALPVVGTSVANPTKTFNTVTALLGVWLIFLFISKLKGIFIDGRL